jgi:hypothetical protein
VLSHGLVVISQGTASGLTVNVEPVGASGAPGVGEPDPDPQLVTSASGRQKTAVRMRDSGVLIISMASFFINLFPLPRSFLGLYSECSSAFLSYPMNFNVIHCLSFGKSGAA